MKLELFGREENKVIVDKSKVMVFEEKKMKWLISKIVLEYDLSTRSSI